MATIEPRTLKGFRDHLPESQMPREWLIDTARRVYRSYGYLPIDTPALEYEEILAGKGGEESDKQMYRFEDHGGRRVALRFDLTVPLARFVAQHAKELGLPFKRYHVGAVWRGENTQRGRYREFTQCDFDTIGTESVASDVETALVIHDLLAACGIERFTVRFNDRRVLNGVLEERGLLERSAEILRVLDKLGKAGPEGVLRELTEKADLRPDVAAEILALVTIEGTNQEILAELRRRVHGERARGGLDGMQAILSAARAAGVAEGRIAIDPTIARGLDYYTGPIFETFLDELPAIGSVCSGGRYDDLASLYTNQRLPGIGASLGLDRLLAALEELGKIEPTRASAPVLLVWFDADRLNDYVAFAARLRAAGIGVELYPEPKKLKAQLSYADRRGFRFAIVIGSDEWADGTCQVKALKLGTSQRVPRLTASDTLHADLLAALGA
jgi:histidyl-tRNA synthetase